MICPVCGYHASGPGDPLLTAHDGMGECPACGIIVAKFRKTHKTTVKPAAPAAPILSEALLAAYRPLGIRTSLLVLAMTLWLAISILSIGSSWMQVRLLGKV
jgi:hypothetical protein